MDTGGVRPLLSKPEDMVAARYDRIRELLGYDPAAPTLAGTLLLALCAHRLEHQVRRGSSA